MPAKPTAATNHGDLGDPSEQASPQRPRRTRRPSPSQPDHEPDSGWLWRPWLLSVAFLAVAVLRSAHVDVPLHDPHHSYLLRRPASTAVVLLVLSLADAAARAGWRDWGAVPALLRERWRRRRVAVVASVLLAYHLVYFSYHNLKSSDVLNAPRDAELLRWDRALFLGHDPAVLLHQLLGDHLAMYALTVVYESFPTVYAIAFVAPFAFCRRARDAYVYLVSAMFVWILGVGSYYAVPSLGPFAVAPGDFAGLAHTVVQDTQATYLDQRAHLLAGPQAHDAFAQISAFASLHVAVTTLMLLMARYYRLRRTSRVAAAFLVGTILATVYLGWHYALDDVAGLLLAVASVRLGRWLVYPPWQADADGQYEQHAGVRAATDRAAGAGRRSPTRRPWT